MGCCFSKCKVRKDSSHHVHDKLVISQDHNPAAMSSDHTPPPPKSPVLLNRKPTSPPPSSDQSSTFSSFSCSTAASSSLRSTSTSTSSVLMQIAKDGRSSFSNEFLRSCAEENPHIVRMKNHPSKTLENPPINAAAAPPPPYRKKRGRANSPPAGSLVRQKSFRRSSPQHYYHNSKINPNVGNMRSPLPNHASSCRRQIVSNSKAAGAVVDFSSPMMYRSFDRNFADDHVMETEMEMDSTFCPSAQELANKIGQDHRILRSRQEDDGVEELDINNPLIALDCFIFL